MQVQAYTKYARMSPRKVREITQAIQGRNAAEAVEVLRFIPRKSARLVSKTLQSAIANAENNEGADVDDLKVTEIFVNEGMTMKRIKPRAKGRADRILKRSCHISVTVTDI